MDCWLIYQHRKSTTSFTLAGGMNKKNTHKKKEKNRPHIQLNFIAIHKSSLLLLLFSLAGLLWYSENSADLPQKFIVPYYRLNYGYTERNWTIVMS
jgi:hypothetical protein